MRRSTSSPGRRSRFADDDGQVGMGYSWGDFRRDTGIASATQKVSAVLKDVDDDLNLTENVQQVRDDIKNLGEKFNIGQSSDDWKRWGKGIVDVATLGVSRSNTVRDAVKELGERWNVGNNSADTLKSLMALATLNVSESNTVRDAAKDLGEKWNVGNNTMDTLKSIANVASIVGAISGIGAMAGAMLGSSSLTQGAMTVAREYARETVKNKVIGKAGEELADPYVDHLIRKARRDAQALAAEEAALVEQYKQQRPGVYSLMMMAVENPNALDQEQMQVIVNYQRDLERERALSEGNALPPDEDWVNYYTRFLAEYGVAWQPPERPGVDLVEGGGLPPPRRMVFDNATDASVAAAKMTRDFLTEAMPVMAIPEQPRVPQSLAFSPELKAALDSLYPPSKTA